MNDFEVKEYFDNFNFDLRIAFGNKRWIDQKCTPDVLWSISDFVCQYVDYVNDEFTPSDIWRSDIAKETIPTTFSKPDVDDERAQNEYDKVFSQPLNLLCYSGVIKDINEGQKHLYIVENRDLLNYIALNDFNSYKFLIYYIEKVLNDSGIFPVFEYFFQNQTQTSYQYLKESFENFCYENTNIQNKLETGRIFTKVINPLACIRRLKGTKRGRLSPQIIRRSDLMYNQDNFRDIYADKPREVTRSEWLRMNPQYQVRYGYFQQMANSSIERLKTSIRLYRDNISEFTQFNDDENDTEFASQIHHIFPKSDFPEIMGFIENLIALTPNQHNLKAHPRNNTQAIDINVQKLLLIAKTKSIELNTNSLEEDTIYSFSNLLHVLTIGWNLDENLQIPDSNYQEVLYEINNYYESYLQ